MSRFTLRMLLLVSLVAALALAATSGAFASTQTDNTNPDLIVTASLLSNGSNPDVAVLGNWVFVRLSVKNVGPQQYVNLLPFASAPNWMLPDVSKLPLMNHNQTLGFALAVPVLRFFPKGDYMLGMAAIGTASLDPSIASANLTIN